MSKVIPLLRIKWRDHFHSQGWRGYRQLNVSEGHVCESVGWRVGEDKKHVVLAQSMATTGQFGDTMHIMKNAIVSRKRLA